MKKYYEKNISMESSKAIYEIAGRLCGGEKENVYLYENKDCVSVGVGIYCEIIVTPEEMVMEKESVRQSIKVSELCRDLDKLFKSVAVDSWRAYGIANFGLARYLYDLNRGGETEELFHFIIPDKEYRVHKDTILLRAFHKEDIERMEKTIANVLPNSAKEKNAVLYDGQEILLFDEEYYKEIVELAVKEIRDKKYQKVILSRKIPVHHRLDMLQTYLQGRQGNTPARSYYYRFPNLEVAGFSPETIAEVDDSGTVYTFPLAGTRALLNDSKANNSLKEELLQDAKEITEHAISVKLADAELEQVCEPDSVAVIEFMSVIERGTVQHLGSRLRGKLRAEYNSWHAFCSLFPAVTASGIPKKEAIEAIGRIEKDARNLYSGAVLTYDDNGTLDAALVLRSIFQNSEETWVRVGAGIVEMSHPQRELTETQEKVSSVARRLVKEG
ncbi:Salicylate synthase [bioreactor metagenome]|nr:salicylate synthase [Desulfitobacterium hafniense]MEA5022351.1 salicylate synthase [Desulfitobacterium hafniense]